MNSPNHEQEPNWSKFTVKGTLSRLSDDIAELTQQSGTLQQDISGFRQYMAAMNATQDQIMLRTSDQPVIPAPWTIFGSETKETYNEWRFRMVAKLSNAPYNTMDPKAKMAYVASHTTQRAFRKIAEKLPGEQLHATGKTEYRDLDELFAQLDRTMILENNNV